VDHVWTTRSRQVWEVSRETSRPARMSNMRAAWQVQRRHSTGWL